MLENLDLSQRVSKSGYKTVSEERELKLAFLQRKILRLGIPVAVVFEGWDAAGKGTLINDLILPLDPRGFKVWSTLPPNEEEVLRPFLWRFWVRTPARGRFAVFDRSWYRRLLDERVERDDRDDFRQSTRDIRAFERQLADGGCVLIKLFLHISKKEQKRRFKKLRGDETTAWRVTGQDLRRHRRYDNYLAAVEDMLAATDSEYAPWTVVEAHDRRFAALKIFDIVITSLESAVAARRQAARSAASTPEGRPRRGKTALDRADLSLSLGREAYKRKLRRCQDRLRELEHLIYLRRIPVVIVYEGWDAAGKGGNIRRLTRRLDPRGYEVIPVAAPNDVEKSHHYLWRFWRAFPKAGHITIFDRSWYGRVLVERVEGLCKPEEWHRAYREIKEMEQHWSDFGAVVVKLWLQIDRDEQLRRFRSRRQTAHKRWKITEEDWRNRRRWRSYQAAVEEMLLRTATRYAPWTIVESNCKLHARIKAQETAIKAISKRLKKA